MLRAFCCCGCAGGPRAHGRRRAAQQAAPRADAHCTCACQPQAAGVLTYCMGGREAAAGPARGPWTNLGRLPLRVFSIGKYAFHREAAAADRDSQLAGWGLTRTDNGTHSEYSRRGKSLRRERCAGAEHRQRPRANVDYRRPIIKYSLQPYCAPSAASLGPPRRAAVLSRVHRSG